MSHGDVSREELAAVFLYMGILEAYESVGKELIGPDMFDRHVLPKMVHYVREFLPEVFSSLSGEADLTKQLKEFIDEFKVRVEDAYRQGTTRDLTTEEVWKLRAAIFGYESAFIEVLGDAAIKDYVFTRMADILVAYLPEQLLDPDVPLDQKLRGLAEYLRRRGFVTYSRVKVRQDEVTVAVNGCAFSEIHDSEAYRNLEVRFCPWGMIGAAIVAAHRQRAASPDKSTFTTRGSVTTIRM